MNYRFALFNATSATIRATTEAFMAIWPGEVFSQEIQPFLDAGVMSIFDKPPNRYTRFFVFYHRDYYNRMRRQKTNPHQRRGSE